MEPAFQVIPFEDPARAEKNLAAIRDRVASPIYAALPTLLQESPDADGALNYFERFTASAPAEIIHYLARHPGALHYLLTVFSYSRFLSETLVQQPELIHWLDRPAERSKLDRVKSKEDLLQEYARFEATEFDVSPAVVLTRFKRREYLRIMLKDVLGMATLGETTIELSTLADVLLEKALALVEQKLHRRFGQPTQVDASGRIVPARFTVLSLGKLGGAELNYSSDVDLFYLYSAEGETSGGEAPDSHISNAEFFIRLAHEITRLISDVTPEGAVFRVDLRLRPQGKEGDLAVSLPAAIEYYRRRADDWERQMLIKARFSAGDATLAREFIRAVQPIIYETAADFEAIESIRDSRERIDRHLLQTSGDAARRLNLKLAPGGIRDIEFLVQCLQRLYGGTDPWVRTGGTLVALTKLFDKGHLHQRDYYRLSTAYQFFRKVEHRLQLILGQQTHSLPREPAEIDRLARQVGLGGIAGLRAGEHFLKVVERHLEQVRAIHDRVIHSSASAISARREEFSLSPTAADLRSPGERSWALLMENLRVNHPDLHRALADANPAGRGQKSFYRFLSAALSSSERFRVLQEQRQLLPLAARIFETSEFLGEMLIREPERLAALGEISVAEETTDQLRMALPLAYRRPLDPALAHITRSRRTLSRSMAELRTYFRHRQFLLGAREVIAPRNLFCALATYSELAEDVLRTALVIAREDVAGRDREASSGRFAIVALGRLGMRELDIGSDVDLVFVCDQATAPAIAFWKRVTERLIQVVSSYTREGTIFPVDARLRPGGGEGELVQTLDYLADYFSSRAESWEAATYLKLRPVAGDEEFGDEAKERIQAALVSRLKDTEKLRSDLSVMRARLESESRPAREEDCFKTGAGGFYDVDYLLSFLQFCDPGRWRFGRGTLEQLDAVAGHLSTEQREALKQAIYFLRSLDHAIRIITGRAPVVLPERVHWEAIARLVSAYHQSAISAASLQPEFERARTEVRRLYEDVFSAYLLPSRH